MSDVSMKRLRDLKAIPEEWIDDCIPLEASSMASELIRLRELIGSPENFSAGSHDTGRVCVWLPFDVYASCRRALLEAEHA